ncbi:hypothetical protein Bca101_082214 [Brassica carinata]
MMILFLFGVTFQSALNDCHDGIEDTVELLETQLPSEISNMSLEEALTLARAFSHFLNMLGVAKTHRIIFPIFRVRRVCNLTHFLRSCNVFTKLRQGGVFPDELYCIVCKQVNATPTRFYSSIIDITSQTP